MMTDEHSSMAMNAISHAADMAKNRIEMAVSAYDEPFTLYRPTLKIDGNQWCALYGEDLISGVAGFGKSPALAVKDFNKNWYTSLELS